jgi:hypothetical protein
MSLHVISRYAIMVTEDGRFVKGTDVDQPRNSGADPRLGIGS